MNIEQNKANGINGKKSSDTIFITIAVIVSSFVTPFMGSSLNVALPSIGKEFNADALVLNWVVSAYLLSTAMFLMPFGRIADLFGRKKIFLYGMIIYSVSSFLSAIAPSIGFLIWMRVLNGIGSTMGFATGMAMLVSVVPAEKRGFALGWNVAAVYLGLSLGPVLGGMITQYFGWEMIFHLNGALGLGVVLIVFLKIKGEWAEGTKGKFDSAGSLIYCMALVFLVYGFSIIPAVNGFIFVALSVFALIVFVKWETSARNPIFDVKMFAKNAMFAFSNLAALTNYAATSGVMFMLSLYLQYVKGFAPNRAGLVLVSQPLIMALFSPWAGRLSDRTEPRIVASIGMAFVTAGLIILIFLDGQSSILFIIASLVVLGFGFALFSSPNTNAVMSSVEKRFYGVASGTLGTMRVVGHIFGMGVVMMVFSLFLGKVKITPERHPAFLDGIRILFVIFSAISFFGIISSLIRGKTQTESNDSKLQNS